MGEDKDFLKLIEDFDKKCHIPDLECEVFPDPGVSFERVENIERSHMSYMDTWKRYIALYDRYRDVTCKYSSGKIGEDLLYEELDDVYMSLYRLLKDYSSYELSFDESTHHIVVNVKHATSMKDIQFNPLETEIAELTNQIYHMIYEKDGKDNHKEYRKNISEDFYAFFSDNVDPEGPIADGGCNSHTTCRIIKIGNKADLNHAPEWFFDTSTYMNHKSHMDHIPDRSVVVSKQYIQLRCPVCGKPITYDVPAAGTNFQVWRMQSVNSTDDPGYPRYRCVNCNSILTYGYRDTLCSVSPVKLEPKPFYYEGDRRIETQIRERFYLTDDLKDRDGKSFKSLLGLKKVLWWIKAFLFCGPFGIFRHMTVMEDEEDFMEYLFGLDFISFLLFLSSTACILTSITYPHTDGSANTFFGGLVLLFILLVITTTVFVTTKEKLNEKYKEKFERN